MGKWRIESAGARPTASENEEGNFLRAGTINRSLRWSCKMAAGAFNYLIAGFSLRRNTDSNAARNDLMDGLSLKRTYE
jgi:hypothetical protein